MRFGLEWSNDRCIYLQPVRMSVRDTSGTCMPVTCVPPRLGECDRVAKARCVSRFWTSICFRLKKNHSRQALARGGGGSGGRGSAGRCGLWTLAALLRCPAPACNLPQCFAALLNQLRPGAVHVQAARECCAPRRWQLQLEGGQRLEGCGGPQPHRSPGTSAACRASPVPMRIWTMRPARGAPHDQMASSRT